MYTNLTQYELRMAAVGMVRYHGADTPAKLFNALSERGVSGFLAAGAIIGAVTAGWIAHEGGALHPVYMSVVDERI